MGWLTPLKRPRIFIPIIILIAVTAFVVLLIKNMTAPAIGNISQTPPAQAVNTDPYAQPGNYHGRYISFSYPAHFKPLPSKLTGLILETADYHSTDLSGRIISVQVNRANTTDSSDISYRRQHKELYVENDSQKWLEFTKKDGAEDTFFLAHDGFLASVSATAPGGGIGNEALYVASSLKWLR